jgi:hypothetical protein
MTAAIKTIDLKEKADRQMQKTRRTPRRNVPRDKTILLLPHCLRVSATCRARGGDDGLICVDCNSDCHVNMLRKEALRQGFRGVCIAPGGSMALKYVKKMKPAAIIAVACEKELSEGIENVRELFGEKQAEAPAVTIIPLIKDGCLDTLVDIDSALKELSGDERFPGEEYDNGRARKAGAAW